MDSSLIQYTGLNLSYIPVTTNTDLETILGLINTKFNTSSSAPDYTGYSLACVKQTDGVTHPTNTQNFAEGISKMLCDFKTAYTSFVNTTYDGDLTTTNAAIADLQVPAVTYSPFSITNTDTVTQVWTKLFTGITGIRTAINPNGANWSGIGASAQTTITTGFDTIINKIISDEAILATKQASLGTFNNSANCLSGSSTDSATTTINLLRTYICTLPTFDDSAITWGSITTATDLQDTLQNIISQVDLLSTNMVATDGNGITLTAVGGTYDGVSVAIDTTFAGLYKVAISGSDVGTADFLEDKITSLDGSLTIDTTTNPDKLDLSITSPFTGKVKVNSSDSSSDYLAFKIEGSTSDWGLGISPSVSTNNEKVVVSPTLNASTFISKMFDYISTNPTLLAKFCALKDQCNGCLCDTITDLTITLDVANTEFDLTWTPTGGTTTSQIAKYRALGSSNWITNNFTPANNLSDVATTTTAKNLNTNTVYQFQVDSNCPGDVSNSNIYEAVIFECQTTTLTQTSPTASHWDIRASQNPLTVDTVEYRLKNPSNAVVENISATGSNPVVLFSTVATNGTWKVEWRYVTLVNGVTVYSTDADQLNAWCSQTIVLS